MAETTTGESTRSRVRVPHTLVLLFAMIVGALLLSYVLPQGHFETFENVHGREQVVPDSYARVESPERLSPLAALTAVPRGFSESQDIIFFIFIVGGAFGVFRATGAADAAIGALLRRLGDRPAWLVLGGMLVFAAGSSTIGMAEEYLPFVPILLALCLGLGFDAVTAVGVLCVGYGVGYGTAALNPFTVLIAQEVAGLPPASGLWFRLVLFPFFLALGFHHVWRYARRVKKEPGTSLVADQEPPAISRAHEVRFGHAHTAALVVTLGALVLLIVGLSEWHWYLEEMGALFLGLTLVLGLVARIGPDALAKEFALGASELTTTALLVGFARAIKVVLDEGAIIDTIIQGVAAPLGALGASAAAVGMFFVQSACNFFIPSGSGQAYVTMPVMAPLGDLVGVSRQVAVLAYQFGDGFTNILVPTNAVLVGILAMAGVPYDRWFRFILPFMLKVWAVGSVALVVAVVIGY